MRKIIKYIIFLIIALPMVSVSCSDDDKDTSLKVTRLKVANAENNIMSLEIGDTQKIEVAFSPDEATDMGDYKFRFSTSDTLVFEVDDNGIITALGLGEAALRVDAVNNTDLWTICVIKVATPIYPVTSIEIPDDLKTHYIGVDRKFDLGTKVIINPENATDPNVIYISSDEMIATVDDRGFVSTHALGDVTITVRATDGSNAEAQCLMKVRNITDYIDLSRVGWNVTISHAIVNDAAVNGDPSCLIDDDMTSCLLLVKPGKTFGGVTIPADGDTHFVLDLADKKEVNYLRLRHRTGNTSANLRVSRLAVYGSNDNVNYKEIVKEANVATDADVVTAVIEFPQKANYRYLKVRMLGWNSSGNTIQISDVNVGLAHFEE